jgi:hypothetical protein
MSLLETRVLPTLKGKYEAKVKSYKEITNEKGGYIEVIFALKDREYKYCIFPSQLEYVTSALRNQFDMRDKTVTLADMLKLATKKSINVWFSWNPDIQKMNVALHEPSVSKSEEAVDL